MLKKAINKYHIQLAFFSFYLLVQTLLLRFVYQWYAREAYKITAWSVFPILIAIILVFIKKNKWNKADLGLRVDNIKKALPLYSFITLLLVFGVILLKQVLSRPIRPDLFTSWHFRGLFILSSLAQAFIFKSYLVKLQSLVMSSNLQIILLNGFLFGLMHTMVIAEPIWFSFLTAFVMGAVFAYVYLKYPNLILATISHAIINFLISLSCFFSFKC
ncbi:MAG: type II CAAX endopeptidase family protein [Patescibacteria group bacterium]